MPATTTNISLGGKRPAAILVMLLTSLLLMAVLGWQSWRLQQSNAATADSVLREYGILVADEFSRRSTAAIGYAGYYQMISGLGEAQSIDAMLDLLERDSRLAAATTLAGGIFLYDANGLVTADLDQSPELGRLLQQVYEEPNDDSAPYRSARTASLREQIIYAGRTGSDGSRRVFGFTTSASGIGERLQTAFDASPLLPPSLADGRLGNDLLFARVSDPAGRILFETNPQFDSTLKISKILGDDYQGILQGFTVEVSVDPGSASSLVIGGLPESQLPLLLAVMTMAVVLMLTAIWLFRREHAVMKLRTDFVSQVSHELRTPLTQIRMFAETLLLERTRTDAERRRSLEIIDRESRRLSHLVDNILRFSNISDATRIDRHWQALSPVVREVCDTMTTTANGVTIRLDADDSVRAKIDADALRQVLLNLLDNAIKFGPQEQDIRVSVMDGNGRARVSVEDQGPGIPQAEHERVWDAFYRMKREEDTAISGTGIGLSVVQELVEAMEGRCWIESANGGTRVTIEFPGNADND